jgi:hypothetical protein
MAPRLLARSLAGHLATALAALVTTGLAVTGTASMFYEGWGQPLPHLLAYVAPAGVLLVLCLVALRWPREGGLLLLAAGLAAVGWWFIAQTERGMVPLGVLLLSALTMIAPVAAATALFLLEARHRRLLFLEGAAPSSRWIARNARYVLVAGVPLAAVAIFASVRLPELLARHDDGQRGRRTIMGSGVTLTWAPLGPGWNGKLDTGEYPSWDDLARHGSPPLDRCAYLDENGTTLLPSAMRIWRLPAADEILRTLTRDGENAGCAWDGRSPHAACRRPPDKETPLWAPDEAPIYYWSASEADARTALAVNYTGGISYLPKSVRAGVGFRCVRSP